MAKKTSKTKMGLGIGAGLAVAAAAVGYYLYGTKDGIKKRKKLEGWMLRAKGEILDRLEELEDVTEEQYNEIVDTVLADYKKIKDSEKVEKLQKDLKKHWKNLKKHFAKGK